MDSIVGQSNAANRRFAIVASRWNEYVVNSLVDGALDEFARHGGFGIRLVRVPGAWEIPFAASVLAKLPDHERPHAIVVLGCILQGATHHATQLAQEVGAALMRLQMDTGIPIAWGVLAAETQEQAIERAGMKLGNKGREAAASAIEMADVANQIDARANAQAPGAG